MGWAFPKEETSTLGEKLIPACGLLAINLRLPPDSGCELVTNYWNLGVGRHRWIISLCKQQLFLIQNIWAASSLAIAGQWRCEPSRGPVSEPRFSRSDKWPKQILQLCALRMGSGSFVFMECKLLKTDAVHVCHIHLKCLMCSIQSTLSRSLISFGAYLLQMQSERNCLIITSYGEND